LATRLKARYAMGAVVGPMSVLPPSIVRPMVISRKLSRIDPQLLWNTTMELASLSLLLRSDRDRPQMLPCEMFGFQIEYMCKY